jgi:xanthine dehydrogenase, molybdenum binding subunit apoprotein (EC 1.17.1.4)
MTNYIGSRVPRFEDLRTLTGRGEYADDLPTPPNTHYVKILRSTHAHAKIKRIDASKALKLPGVVSVITGQDIKQVMDPYPLALHVPIKYYPIAIDKVRYVGEPVAVVVARDPFTAEDALELIDIEYEPLKPVLSIEDALKNDSIIHEEVVVI